MSEGAAVAAAGSALVAEPDLAVAAPVLEVEDVVVEFDTEGGRITAVDGVSLQLAEGETLGLVGESGCGKSTLARAVMRLVRMRRGSVHLEGTDLASLSTRELRRRRHRIQMVFQDPRGSLDPRMSVSTLIGEPLRVHRIGDRASRAKEVADAMELVGLPASVADRLPSELSGGQQQRVGIARAIVTDPAVLVCDEPVSALDVSIQAQIINVFGELREELSVAMLFISHDLSVVRHLSDRVAVMYLGPDRGDGHRGRGVLGAPPSLHAGPDLGRAPGRRRQRGPAPDRPPPGARRAAQPPRPAVGMPLSHPLPLRHRGVCRHRAAPGGGGTGGRAAFGALSPLAQHCRRPGLVPTIRY